MRNHSAEIAEGLPALILKRWEATGEESFKVGSVPVIAYAVLGIMLPLLASGAERQADQAASDRTTSELRSQPTDETLARGKEIFAKQCTACHGMDGKGQGIASYLLYPKPRNLTNRLVRLTSNTDGLVDVRDIFDTITRGMPGSAMPPWDQYSESDRWAIAHYVKSLSRKDKRPPERVEPPTEIAATAEGIARGRQVFLQACAACHGQSARGDGNQEMLDENGFPIRPRDLTTGIFKGGKDSKQLYWRISNGMPGSPMPAHAETFKSDDIWNLVHYVQSLSGDGGELRNHQLQRTLTAQKVSESLAEPNSPAWELVKETYLPMMPLWWRDDRPEGVVVKAAYDGSDLYLRLTWPDMTENSAQLQAQQFRDGAAVQISGDEDPPFFAMGQPGASAVKIWYWKADREKDLAGRQDIHTEHPNMYVTTYPGEHNAAAASEKMGVDYQGTNDARSTSVSDVDSRYVTALKAGNIVPELAKAAVESLTAKGFGTLGFRPNIDKNVTAKGVWSGGSYTLVFKRSMKQDGPEALTLKPGGTYHVAFAVWDGAAGDRNGSKSVTIWHKVKLAE